MRDQAAPRTSRARSNRPTAARRDRADSTPRRNGPETRERILYAAIREFSRNGFSGARVQEIARTAPTNIRMIYHYFGSKAALYVAVLERGLQDLRSEEQKLSVTTADPVDGLLTLFDFIFGHFAAHQELVSLLSNENIHKATFLRRSGKVSTMSSPTIKVISSLLEKARRAKPGSQEVDALQLYVTMVALSYFHLSNAHTLSVIFRRNLLRRSWIRARHKHARAILSHHLKAVLLRAAPKADLRGAR